MPINEDPDLFGTAALAWLDDRAKDLLYVERDDGGVSQDSISHYFYQEGSPFKGYQQFLLNYVKDPILDLGCGPGRFLIPLVEMGHQVVGVDASRGVLKAARLSTSRHLTIIQLSITALGFKPNYFRTILAAGHNIGAVGSLQKLQELLLQLSTMSTLDASFLLTSVDVSKIPDEQHRLYYENNLARGRYLGQERMRLRFADRTGYWFDWIFITPNDLDKIASQNGWRISEIVSDDKRPDRYAAVLKRNPKG